MRIDLFCKVVDNFGDAGVCWRLARQLLGEQRCDVRLWVDDLDCLAKLRPDIAVDRQGQRCAGVEVCRWSGAMADIAPPEVVIEAFGCRLPDAYLEAMARRNPSPVWINLEYLTAEEWADGCHTLPSPHPRLPLTCHFFYPGFSPANGGLPGERDLLSRRDHFRAATAARAAFWRERLGIDAPPDGTTTVSLFCYDNPALADLIGVWRDTATPVRVLVPCGARPDVLATLNLHDATGSRATDGALTAQVIPFLAQDDYDRLLWSCEVNFVRGEDSFVRALWAGAPLVWQAYPQADDAHHAKLEAFIQRYCVGIDAGAASAYATLLRLWNGISTATPPAVAWAAFRAAAPELERHAAAWAQDAIAHGFLAENLASFCRSKLKY